MTEILGLVVGISIGTAIGFIIFKLMNQSKNTDFEKQISDLVSQKKQLESENEQSKIFLGREIQSLKQDLEIAKNKSQKEQEEREKLIISDTQKSSRIVELENKLSQNKEEIEATQEKLKTDFKLLASEILEDKSSKFTEKNKENIEGILKPLQEKILQFERKVETTQKENISIHSALREQLTGLKTLNQQITKEAENLTKALKGENKTQGNWGELVLEKVLEKSGLEKDREYFVQQSFINDEGKRQLPDVIIALPDEKKLVIDSKVSLVNYERYVNSESIEESTEHLKLHIQSIKRHVQQLSEKRYYDLSEIISPDFVLLFIPIEAAFAVALNQENTLYNQAFEKNIIIVTPTTLLATLKTIDTMWNNEKQQRNALEIADAAGRLYDKFFNLVEDLKGVGKKMDDSKQSYQAAMNKLFEGRGNVITSIEKLKKMGAKAKKQLPQPILDRANEADEND